MPSIPPSLPRIHDPELLDQDPLACLAAARERHGDCVGLRDGAALLSHNPGCPGVVALFGAAGRRQVLTASEDFVATPSTARALHLPEAVVRLTQSLHVMHGHDHAAHKAVIAAALAPARDGGNGGIADAIARFADGWRSAGEIAIFGEIQRLTAEIAISLLFGAGQPAGDALLEALPRFFALRRQLSDDGRSGLVVEAGHRLDALLGDVLAAGDRNQGVAARLARALPEPAVRAHLNVLFMSLVEPVAVAATWMLLVLTQRPRLRRRLRAALELAPPGTLPAEMKHCMLETLRLLSPNALMVRVAARGVHCAGVALPAQCEIVLIPFLAHRDPAVFADPNVFRPDRWAAGRTVSPFEFMPFGAGTHACVGRRLAESLVAQIVGGVLMRVDPVLSHPQTIDWRIDITFRPRVDFKVAAEEPGFEGNRISAIWAGPVAELVQFESENP